MKSLEDLRIYKLAVEVGEDVWKVVTEWESFSKWTIGKQLVDAADGISASMIEGYYRNQPGDLVRFFQYALSSAKETQLWLWKAKERNLVDKPRYDAINSRLTNLIPQTVNFYKRCPKEAIG
jgi:four helix bundle protein